MAEAFKIGEGYVEIDTRVDDRQVARDADKAGETFESKFSTSLSRRGRRNRPGRFMPDDVPDREGSRLGSRLGGSLIRGIGGALASGARLIFSPKTTEAIGGAFMSVAKSPPVLAALVAAAASIGTLLASGIAATLSAAMVGGLGLGVIGLGAWLLREDKGIQNAAKSLGKTASDVFTKAAAPMRKPFIAALGIFEKMIKRLQPVIDSIFANIAPAITPLANGIAGMIEAMAPGIQRLSEVAGPFLIDLAEALPGVGKSIGDFLTKIADNWPKIQESFETFMGDLGKVIGVLAGAFVWLASNYETVRNVILGAIAIGNIGILAIVGVAMAIKGFAENVGGWLSGAWGAVSGFFSNLWTTITGWVTGTKQWLSDLWTTITGWIGQAVAWFGALPGRIGAGLAALPGIVMGLFQSMIDKVLFGVGFVIGWVIRQFIELPGNVRRGLSTLWSAMQGIWDTVKRNVTTWVSTAVNNAVTWLRGLPGKARSAISSLWSNMVGAFNSAKTNATNSASALVSGTVSWLRGLPGKARSAIAGIPGQIKSVFSGAGSWRYSAGSNILSGLVRGMKGAVGAAIGAAKDAAMSVINGLKRGLGIASPSKVAEEEVGRWIPPGITRGIAKAIPKEQQEINGLMPRVATQAAQPVAGAAGAGSTGDGGIHIGTLVLKGILDPSDPQSVQRLMGWIYEGTARYQKARTA